MFRKAILLALSWACGLSAGLGRDLFELQSTYQGDGCFEYRLRTLEDPFFTEITFFQLVPWPFTNYVSNTLPPHWTNYFYQTTWNGIMFDESVSQPRLNEIVFSAQSTATSFKRKDYAFTTVLNFLFNDRYLGGLGGYINFNCLLPCAPEEADGSPTNLVCRVELIPDIKIDQLLVTNGNIHGLTFSWDEPSTVELQASQDMVNWTNVARFFGDPPRTTWTTNPPLNSLGQFFRLSLVANYHLTNALTAKALAASSPLTRDIPIASQDLLNNQARIGFASVPQAVYEVDFCEWCGSTIATRRIEATDAFTTVSFDLGEPRKAVHFKVRQLLN